MGEETEKQRNRGTEEQRDVECMRMFGEQVFILV